MRRYGCLHARRRCQRVRYTRRHSAAGDAGELDFSGARSQARGGSYQGRRARCSARTRLARDQTSSRPDPTNTFDGDVRWVRQLLYGKGAAYLNVADLQWPCGERRRLRHGGQDNFSTFNDSESGEVIDVFNYGGRVVQSCCGTSRKASNNTCRFPTTGSATIRAVLETRCRTSRINGHLSDPAIPRPTVTSTTSIYAWRAMILAHFGHRALALPWLDFKASAPTRT